MYKSFTALMAMASMATAAPFARQEEARKLVIGSPGQIVTADFTGDSFKLTSKFTKEGMAPSWMLYRDPNVLYAVNENAADVNLFNLDNASSNPTLAGTVQGTAGVVSLAFNEDKTKILGPSYGKGSYDVWDVQADNKLNLFKNVVVKGELGPGQESHRPHQALLDPSGRYFVVPNLGGDSILVVDTQNDSYEVTNTVGTPSGSGPRHGDFVSLNGGSQASHYVVCTELSNELILFSLEYAEDSLKFTELQRLSTYGPDSPPATPDKAAAGELVIANNGRDVYVSNRLSGHETDNIAHFVLEQGTGDKPELRFADSVSSGGILPRMFSLSSDADQSLVFVANQGGELGIAALKRDPKTGKLDASPAASLPLDDLVADEFKGQENVGPQFIQQIQGVSRDC